MNKTHLVFTIITIVATILMPACRSTKQITSTQTQTTSISQMEIDSATSRLMTTHRKTTSITVLPMQIPALPPIQMPDAQTPAQDLITQLLQHGGGTIIIQEEDTQTQDQTNTTTQISQQDTTNTQNTQYHEKQSNLPRASPNLKLILYILLAAIVLILLIRFRIRQ